MSKKLDILNDPFTDSEDEEEINTNCLEGFRCPNCKSLGPFKIAASCVVLVYDDGTDDGEGYEWGDESYCECYECAKTGTVKDFRVEDKPVEDEAAHGCLPASPAITELYDNLEEEQTDE